MAGGSLLERAKRISYDCGISGLVKPLQEIFERLDLLESQVRVLQDSQRVPPHMREVETR